MFGEMFYTPVYIGGRYAGRFVGWGKEFEGERNFSVVLYVTDDGMLHGNDYALGISFPELAKDNFLHE